MSILSDMSISEINGRGSFSTTNCKNVSNNIILFQKKKSPLNTNFRKEYGRERYRNSLKRTR